LKSVDNKKTFLYHLMEWMVDNGKSNLLDITTYISGLKQSNIIL